MAIDNTLYDKGGADLYNLIADDRDFSKECNEIVSIYRDFNSGASPTSTLELFAGPAYHCKFFKNEFSCSVHAIDSSEAMREIAVNQHDLSAAEYLVGHLPEILDSSLLRPNYDIIIALRYSLGLIPYPDMKNLLLSSMNKLKPGGIIVIELHKINLLVNQLNDLDIKSREKVCPSTGNIIRCFWPSGPIQWKDDRWAIKMPVKVEVLNTKDQVLEAYDTVSEEFIYNLQDLDLIFSTSKENVSCIKTVVKPFSNLYFFQKQVGLD